MPLINQVVEASLKDGIEHYLSESVESNCHNGKTSKQLKTTHRSFELETPQDHVGCFEPEIVKKRRRFSMKAWITIYYLCMLLS